MYTATYSPEDNKLRLYTNTDERLPESLYSHVRSHGFIWAPRQELFVTPAWTPEREDFLISSIARMCSAIAKTFGLTERFRRVLNIYYLFVICFAFQGWLVP